MLFLSEVSIASCLFLLISLREKRDFLVTAAHRELVGGTLASLRTGLAEGSVILDPCGVCLGAPCRAVELVNFRRKAIAKRLSLKLPRAEETSFVCMYRCSTSGSEVLFTRQILNPLAIAISSPIITRCLRMRRRIQELYL